MAIKNDKNGANRCPNCGATDVTLNPSTGKLKCSFCRTVFDDVSANKNGGVESLSEDIVGEGATNIIPGEDLILTLKCPACGAEVVINTEEVTSARCHWCRHVLSVNEKMPNGAVPDLVLPFKMEKSAAETKIREFVNERQFFAHPKFKEEFKTDNISGVYLPYMIVDVNASASMAGEAEHLVRKYTVGSGNTRKTLYDADAYDVTRDFDLLVDDLTVEASSDKLNQDLKSNTNNVINAIMPFDTENCVGWNPAYLRGYSSEKRDTNIDALRTVMQTQVGDVARYRVKESMTFYDRGTRWTKEDVKIKGTSWKAAYLPVWLYSYYQEDKKLLHYVAVNARTGETMGSVPINKSKLMAFSVLIEIIGIIAGFTWIKLWLGVDTDDGNPWWLGLAGLTPGFIFYWMKMSKYRNMDKRHKHEADTKSDIKNLKKSDVFHEHRKGLSASRIKGQNDSEIRGVIAKNGNEMMGEKMANYLGIDRMINTTPEDKPIGQKDGGKQK
jgi:ribosomal protein S27E